MTKPPPSPHPLFEPRRDPRRFIGAAVSILFHGILIVLVVRGTVDAIVATNAAGNPLLAPGGGGGGGGGPRYISLPPLPRPPASATAATPQPAVVPPAVAPPITEPVVPQPTPEVVSAPADTQAAPVTGPTGAGPGSGGGSGGGVGGGVGPGVGPGSGPGTGGGGAGGTASAPRWSYGTLLTDKPPKELRGVELRVTFYVGADGRVDRIETDPEIRDGGFAKMVVERTKTFRFYPARNAEGIAVPGISTMSFTLSSK